jgi:hypothetical protein
MDVKVINPELGVLLRDLEFTSASASAALVKARATNGLTAWKNTKTQKTLKDEVGD